MACYQLVGLFLDSLKIKNECDLGNTVEVCDHLVTSAAMHCHATIR